MVPPLFTMIIDVGPNTMAVVSANSLYELADKLPAAGISEDMVYRIKESMDRKYMGFKAAERHQLLDGMVELEVVYLQEWTTGQRLPWYKNSLPPPQNHYYSLTD